MIKRIVSVVVDVVLVEDVGKMFDFDIGQLFGCVFGVFVGCEFGQGVMVLICGFDL